MVDLRSVVDIDPKEVGVTELVYYPVLEGLLEETAGDIEELKHAIRRDLHDLIPKHITKEDILASINYNIHPVSYTHLSVAVGRAGRLEFGCRDRSGGSTGEKEKKVKTVREPK